MLAAWLDRLILLDLIILIIFAEEYTLWNSLCSFFPVRSKYSPHQPLLKHPQSVKSIILWDITPCSPLEVSRRFGGTYRLYLQGRRISRARNQSEAGRKLWSVYSLTLKMEGIYSAETTFDFQRTTRCYIPEYRTSSLDKLRIRDDAKNRIGIL
jgi:hypothetical protein